MDQRKLEGVGGCWWLCARVGRNCNASRFGNNSMGIRSYGYCCSTSIDAAERYMIANTKLTTPKDVVE